MGFREILNTNERIFEHREHERTRTPIYFHPCEMVDAKMDEISKDTPLIW